MPKDDKKKEQKTSPAAEIPHGEEKDPNAQSTDEKLKLNVTSILKEKTKPKDS